MKTAIVAMLLATVIVPASAADYGCYRGLDGSCVPAAFPTLRFRELKAPPQSVIRSQTVIQSNFGTSVINSTSIRSVSR